MVAALYGEDLEVWKPVAGFFGSYEVSNLGRVKSLPKAGNKHRVRILREYTVHHDYRRVGLWDGFRVTQRLVHVLVCEAFHGPRPRGMQVAHNNGTGGDNRAVNLRWATLEDNMADQILHETRRRGDQMQHAVLSEAVVHEIRRRSASGESARQIAEDIGSSLTAIYKVRRRETWAWVQ